MKPLIWSLFLSFLLTQVAAAQIRTGEVERVVSLNRWLEQGGEQVVVFSSPACRYCTLIKPEIQAVAREQREIKFGEFNAATAPLERAKHRVSGFPTTIFFRDGREVSRKVGYVRQNELRSWLRNYQGIRGTRR